MEILVNKAHAVRHSVLKMLKSIVSLSLATFAGAGICQSPAEISRSRETATRLLQAFGMPPKSPLKFSSTRGRELIFVDPGKVEVYVNVPTNTAVMLFNQARIFERTRQRKPSKHLRIQSEAQMIRYAKAIGAKVKVPADYKFDGVRMGFDGTGSASWSARPGGFGFINMGMMVRLVVDRRDGAVIDYGRSTEIEIDSKKLVITKETARRRAESAGFKFLPNHKLGYVLPNSEFGGPGRVGQPPYRLRLAYAFHENGFLKWEVWVDAATGKILGGISRAMKSTVK